MIFTFIDQFSFILLSKTLSALQNGTIDMAIPDVYGLDATKYRPLAISSPVLSGPFVNVPTFAQLGLEINQYVSVYGIAVSPQTSESLRQEISLAFSNITMDPNFISQVSDLGASVLTSYNYESSSLNNFINLMITVLSQILGITPPSSPQKTKASNTDTLAIILGVLIPLFVIVLCIIIILVVFYFKTKPFDLISITSKIQERSLLETMTVSWNAITDLEEIGSGSYEILSYSHWTFTCFNCLDLGKFTKEGIEEE